MKELRMKTTWVAVGCCQFMNHAAVEHLSPKIEDTFLQVVLLMDVARRRLWIQN